MKLGAEIGTVQRVNIERQMKTAYLDYAMSVITARALPDGRDGLKPVQRRILYAMHAMGMFSDRPYRKSARIVGEVLGKYHPHGDAAVYDAMVRMAQDFSTRYLLVDGQGNFGSIDGDSAAAMRYTEARMTKLAEEMLKDIDKNSVDFAENFDGSLQEPLVLPASLPNLLVNGVSGIAVGMATSVPPHNLAEICNALIYLIDRIVRRQRVSFDKLMQLVRGPDFPTGAVLYRYRKPKGQSEPIDAIRKAYATGRGRLIVRAKTHLEDLSHGRSSIVVTETPYQVNKATLIKRIADLARSGRIEQISDLRDESDRTGTRIVIELKRTAQPRQVLNQLFKRSALQTTFSVNLLALVDGEPRVLNLEKALRLYVEHRRQVTTRRTKHEFDLAKRREHVLAGLRIALDNLDEVISTIRRSRTVSTARSNLKRRFKLTQVQAEAILDMPLRRLAALERKKIEDEHARICRKIEKLEGILADVKKILGLIKQDLRELKREYGDTRRTRIVDQAVGRFGARDLIPEENVLVTLTERGYIKRDRVDDYRKQRRGGRGVNGMTTRDRDGIEHFLLASTLDRLLLFTNRGRVFSLNTYQIPEGRRGGKGSPLRGLIDLDRGERATALIALSAEPNDTKNREKHNSEYLVMVTRSAMIKRVEQEEFATMRSSGLTAINLSEGDELGWAKLTEGSEDILLVSQKGQAIRFSESEVRALSRSAQGVRAMRLVENDAIVGVGSSRGGSQLLVVTEGGYGKRTSLTQYNRQKRYGRGIRTVASSEKTGAVAAGCVVAAKDEIAIISADGVVIRLSVRNIPLMGRNARGSRLVNLQDGDTVASVARIIGDGGARRT